jgi:hypothetical protein
LLPSISSTSAGYNGGYTVSIYGSHIANGIDAVQMEFGGNMRRGLSRAPIRGAALHLHPHHHHRAGP